jgi:hypothetical protein
MNTEINNTTDPVDLSTPTTKILAIGHWTEKGSIKNDRLPVMIKEVPATVNLYLTGAIEQWYVKPDLSGVVFIMNVTTPAEANQLLEKLPLGVAKMMAFDFIPLGPITPLRFLLKNEVVD